MLETINFFSDQYSYHKETNQLISTTSPLTGLDLISMLWFKPEQSLTYSYPAS